MTIGWLLWLVCCRAAHTACGLPSAYVHSSQTIASRYSLAASASTYHIQAGSHRLYCTAGWATVIILSGRKTDTSSSCSWDTVWCRPRQLWRLNIPRPSLLTVVYPLLHPLFGTRYHRTFEHVQLLHRSRDISRRDCSIRRFGLFNLRNI